MQGLKVKKEIRIQTKEVADHGWPKALTSRARVDATSFRAEGARSTPLVHQQLLRHAALCPIHLFTFFPFFIVLSQLGAWQVSGVLLNSKRLRTKETLKGRNADFSSLLKKVTDSEKYQQEPPRPRSFH
jgi:hypothetical protein